MKEDTAMISPIDSALTLAEALERIQTLEESLKTSRVEAVREVLGLLQVDGSGFYYNEPNDYGTITVTVYPGQGDPWEMYRGPEVQSNFIDGRRGTGRYRLNEALVPVIIEQMDNAKKPNRRVPSWLS